MEVEGGCHDSGAVVPMATLVTTGCVMTTVMMMYLSFKIACNIWVNKFMITLFVVYK